MTILNNGIANSMIFLSQEPLSDRLKMASLNTLLGIGIVFAVLILITLLISLFKLLPNSKVKSDYKVDSDKNVSPVDNVIAQIISKEEADLINDYELVAAITAAITAFNSENTQEAVPADGFVVRSIRKINRKRNF